MKLKLDLDYTQRTTSRWINKVKVKSRVGLGMMPYLSKLGRFLEIIRRSNLF